MSEDILHPHYTFSQAAQPGCVQWEMRLPPLLRGAEKLLPWFSRNGRSGMVLAGGSVVSMVVHDAKASDYDIFLVRTKNGWDQKGCAC